MNLRIMLILAAIMVAGPSVLASDRFEQRFGRDPFNKRILRYAGSNTRGAIEETNKGLVINLPVDKSGQVQVGVTTKFKVVGDFEITAGYELLNVEKPEKGYGAGVVVRLNVANGSKTQATFACRRRKDGRNVLNTVMKTQVGEKTKRDQKVFDAESYHGQLRLIRTGPTLQYLIKDGDEKEFRELRQIKVGTEPLNSVQVLADAGGSEQPMTVRLTHLQIRAEELPFGLPESNRKAIWGIWTIFGLLGACVLVGSGVWYWHRH